MFPRLKRALRSVLLDTPWWDRRQQDRDTAETAAWESAGRPAPSPASVKRAILAEYGAAFGLRTLIETGTFMGDTMYVLRDRFSALYTIELSPELWDRARRRFRKLPQVHPLHGDSADVLPEVVSTLTAPALFWLDGHFSGGVTAQAALDTPIMKELKTIFAHPVAGHVILIDDARLFDGTHDYPTIEEIVQVFAENLPAYAVSVRNDVIRAHPPTDFAAKY